MRSAKAANSWATRNMALRMSAKGELAHNPRAKSSDTSASPPKIGALGIGTPHALGSHAVGQNVGGVVGLDDNL